MEYYILDILKKLLNEMVKLYFPVIRMINNNSNNCNTNNLNNYNNKIKKNLNKIIKYNCKISKNHSRKSKSMIIY